MTPITFSSYSNYEYEFKTSLKEASNNDEQYKNWVEKCNQETFGTKESLYQIDTKGFLHFKNQIYFLNEYNIKHIMFREFHDNLYAGHPRYQKFITNLMKYFY